MSLSINALFGLKRAPSIIGPVVNIPLAVRFSVTDCDWGISGGKLHHVNTTTTKVPIPTATGDLDAWAVRSDFLRVASEDGLIQFLNRTGVFNRDREHWTVTDLFQFQRVIDYLLKTSPARWRALKSVFRDNDIVEAVTAYQTARIEFVWNEASHAALIRTNTTLGAMLATVHVDHVRGAKFSFCARCRRQFEIESEHPRKYCSAECAHAEAVHQYRERKKLKVSR